MRYLQTLILAAAAILASPVAQAVRCTVTNAVGPLYAGGVPQLQANARQAEGSIEITCDPTANPANPLPVTGPLTVMVALTRGDSSSYSARRYPAMGPLYNLYLDAGRQQVWGDGTGGSQPASLQFTFGPLELLTPKSQSLVVYGSIQAGVTARPLTYSETLGISVIY